MTNYESPPANVFGALSDPTRCAIVVRLARGSAPVGELAAPTGLRLPTVMRHIAVLEEAGLVASRKRGRSRICTLRPEALAAGTDWLERQQSVWNARLDRLGAFVTENHEKDLP